MPANMGRISAPQWVAATTLGLAAGVGLALVLGAPIQAVVGVMLVTPILTSLVGGVLGLSQSFPLRQHLAKPWTWIVASSIGCGLGLAIGVVVVENGGRLLAGHAVNVVRLGPAERALSFAIVGLLTGALLGLCQAVVLRRQETGVRRWALRTAFALGAAFSGSSLLVDLLVGGIGSAAGVASFAVAAGVILGVLTARPLAAHCLTGPLPATTPKR